MLHIQRDTVVVTNKDVTRKNHEENESKKRKKKEAVMIDLLAL